MKILNADQPNAKIIIEQVGDHPIVFHAGLSAGLGTPERMRIDGATGNVGIGTASPNDKLEISGAAGSNEVRITNTDNNRSSFLGHDAEGTFIQVSNNGDTWSFRNNSGGQIITANPNTGNVGIGTKTPGAKLEVAGQIKITGGSPGAGKVLTADASGLASWQEIVYQDCRWLDIYNRNCNGIPGCSFSGARLTLQMPAPWVVTGGNYNSPDYADALWVCKLVLQ